VFAGYIPFTEKTKTKTSSGVILALDKEAGEKLWEMMLMLQYLRSDRLYRKPNAICTDWQDSSTVSKYTEGRDIYKIAKVHASCSTQVH
jgi:hypothetical protein